MRKKEVRPIIVFGTRSGAIFVWRGKQTEQVRVGESSSSLLRRFDQRRRQGFEPFTAHFYASVTKHARMHYVDAESVEWWREEKERV